MKWDMEMEQIEVVLERIWDLHDKISDAIHLISRAQFLKSIKNLARPSEEKNHPPDEDFGDGGDERSCGYVFIKGFRADEDAALAEARSLNAIRSALENLEDQIEFFHTVQSQQQAEREAAIARLEQSRIILALRLSEHQGEKHKVIEEAQAFVSDVQEASQFIAPESLFVEPFSGTGGQDAKKDCKLHSLMQRLISSLAFAKSSLCLDRFGGVLGNAAVFAVSMLAFLQMQRAANKQEAPDLSNLASYRSKSERMASSKVDYSSRSGALQYFDVYSARG